ncbi:hypothetical protein PMSD_01200 [Paenibacillus macquariensis subsp. defensor]|nr:hypothetical protein PMSD_01200 [Paenibacillus macquariensis subsp. defensor]
MGKIKALLVGVCEYPATGLPALPLCENDLYAVRTALINGLKVALEDVYICGETGMATSSDLANTMLQALTTITNEDTFIFYFTGHGGKNCLALSDGSIALQELIDLIENTSAKSKIIVLDACHSGGFSVGEVPHMVVSATVESFAGRGYAVLASCGAEEFSGFNPERKISLYTSFFCDALTSRFTITKGTKSLEAINNAIFRYAEVWNRNGRGNVQRPIFRSNIGGTIFFEVEDYNPYEVAEVYEETDKFIIYSVEPVHHGIAKRLAVRVILRDDSSMEQIAEIASEVKEKVLLYEVHQNEIAEARHTGNPANIVWCYFGYDEDDMIDANYICHTTWVDESQDKNWWYRQSQNTLTVNGVHIDIHSSYEMIKNMMHSELVDKDNLIMMRREYSAQLISLAEQYIRLFREFRNNTLSENDLIENVAPISKKISQLFFKQSDLPVPPKELHDWAQAQTQIACTIHDFSLYYDKNHLNKWPSNNRKNLMDLTINRYEAELEVLKHTFAE